MSLNVVAYKIEAYYSIFGDLLNYIRPFDLGAFQATAGEILKRERSGPTKLAETALQAFKAAHSWQATQSRFLQALVSFEAQPAQPLVAP